MNNEKAVVIDPISGLSPADPTALMDFAREMTEEVIPKIVKVVEERRLRATETRLWQLKC